MSTSFGANVKEEKKDDRETTAAAPPAKRRATAAAAFDRIAASGRKAAAAIADFVAEVEAGRAFLVDAAAGAEAPSGTAGDAGVTTSTIASVPDAVLSAGGVKPTASTLGGAATAVPDWAAAAVATRQPGLEEAAEAVKDGVERALRSDDYQGFVKVGNKAVSKEKVARARGVIARHPNRLLGEVKIALEVNEEMQVEWDVNKVVLDVVHQFGK
jgi:hypothetical protein